MIKSMNINNLQNIFFIGTAGAGMSSIAQYLAGTGKTVSGSDRFFSEGQAPDIRQKLTEQGITCFPQDTSGVHSGIDLVVISSAIEPTVPEYQKSLELGIPVVKRSELLAEIARTKRTIGIAGTSGKSTVTAMVYHILNFAGFAPSLITGAGLTSLEQHGKIGNAVAGEGEWLVIEIDESDGSIVNYTPEIGVILNIEKDHKELAELARLFEIFANNVTDKLIVNQDNNLASKYSKNTQFDFGTKSDVGFAGSNFSQKDFRISFKINAIPFEISQIGHHNFENVMASVAAASLCGVSIAECAEALKTYSGISRRTSLLGMVNGVQIIDDYAHNPVKLAAAIRACQPADGRLFVWFQPHGFGPTKFLRSDFVQEISNALRENDVVLMSEIFYAGGTANRDISAGDLISDILAEGKKAIFIPNRTDLFSSICDELNPGDVLLLTGARDPSLGHFAKEIFDNLSNYVG